MYPIYKAREEFPCFNRFIYADVAARNPLCNRVRNAIEGYLDDRQTGAETKENWFAKVEKVREKVAFLLNAEPEEIAFVKNTSDGINCAGMCLPWEEGDNVVIVPEYENPNNVYPWLGLQKRLGIEVKIAQLNGEVPERKLLEPIMDRKTRCVAISSVSFTFGSRVDINEILSMCKKYDALLLIDAVQSLGVLKFDVKETPIDFITAATSKSLLGLYGLGILYCRRELAEMLHPLYLARFGIDIGGAHEGDFGGNDYKLARGARRFEIGNYNYLGIYALDAALDFIFEVGMDVIETHVLSLTKKLTHGLQKLGYKLVSPLEEKYISHVVVFTSPKDGPSEKVISQTLDKAGVRHSCRRNGVRLSFHMYNQESDINYILETLSRLCV